MADECHGVWRGALALMATERAVADRDFKAWLRGLVDLLTIDLTAAERLAWIAFTRFEVRDGHAYAVCVFEHAHGDYMFEVEHVTPSDDMCLRFTSASGSYPEFTATQTFIPPADGKNVFYVSRLMGVEPIAFRGWIRTAPVWHGAKWTCLPPEFAKTA